MKIICLICLDKFTEKSNVSSTPCGHLFHSNCISKSLVTTKNECPQCRADCSKNVHKVFLQCEPEDDKNYQSEPPVNSKPLDLQHPQRFQFKRINRSNMSQQPQLPQHPQRPRPQGPQLFPQPLDPLHHQRFQFKKSNRSNMSQQPQRPQGPQPFPQPLNPLHPQRFQFKQFNSSNMSQQPQLPRHRLPGYRQRPQGPQPTQLFQQLLDLQHPQGNVFRSNMSQQPQPSQLHRQNQELPLPMQLQSVHQSHQYSQYQYVLNQHSQTLQRLREPKLHKPAHQP